MTFSRLHITAFLGIAALARGSVLHLQGVPITWDHLAPFGTVVGVLTTLGMGLERALWALRPLHGWFVERPDLRGIWKVQIESDWEHPATGRRIPTITGYMGVEQTLSTLKMHLMTKESESWFIADRIRPSPNVTGYQVVAVYTNKPDVHLRGDRSEIHQGALVLETHGSARRPASLAGEYWTDRKTTGRMTLSDRRSQVFTRFEDAEAAFAEPA